MTNKNSTVKNGVFITVAEHVKGALSIYIALGLILSGIIWVANWQKIASAMDLASKKEEEHRDSLSVNRDNQLSFLISSIARQESVLVITNKNLATSLDDMKLGAMLASSKLSAAKKKEIQNDRMWGAPVNVDSIYKVFLRIE